MGNVVLGDAPDDSLIVNGYSRLMGSIVVDGNLTLGTGANDCEDVALYCYSMHILDPSYCASSLGEMNCQATCHYCNANPSPTYMHVVAPSTWESDVTIFADATLTTQGNTVVGGNLTVLTDVTLGLLATNVSAATRCVTRDSNSTCRPSCFVCAGVLTLSSGGRRVTVYGDSTSWGDASLLGNSTTIGDAATDLLTVNCATNFTADGTAFVGGATFGATTAYPAPPPPPAARLLPLLPSISACPCRFTSFTASIFFAAFACVLTAFQRLKRRTVPNRRRAVRPLRLLRNHLLPRRPLPRRRRHRGGRDGGQRDADPRRALCDRGEHADRGRRDRHADRPRLGPLLLAGSPPRPAPHRR